MTSPLRSGSQRARLYLVISVTPVPLAACVPAAGEVLCTDRSGLPCTPDTVNPAAWSVSKASATDLPLTSGTTGLPFDTLISTVEPRSTCEPGDGSTLMTAPAATVSSKSSDLLGT